MATDDLTHASFFSGVGGLDLGLERAGWRTVSFSEIDPYASAVLAERWPGVPNLGDIVALLEGQRDRDRLLGVEGGYGGRIRESVAGGNGSASASGGLGDGARPHTNGHATRPPVPQPAVREPLSPRAGDATGEPSAWRRLGGDERSQDALPAGSSVRGGLPSLSDLPQGTERPLLEQDAWMNATLWSGGFPCQDLSVAGKRKGLSGERSGLALTFLDLVERHRPPAILLENVPGLLSSNGGRDFGALLRAMGELGYGWAYRVLDARHFGVPQRRRRVFIVGLHAGTGLGADSAAAVLSVGTRCDRHPATGHQAGAGTASSTHGSTDGTGIFNATAKFGEFVEDDTAGNLSARDYKSSNHLIGAPPDPGGNGTPHGMARGLDDSQVAATLNSGGNNGGFRTEPGEHLVQVYTKRARVSGPDTPESWKEGGVMPTPNSFDVGDTRTTGIIIGDGPQDDPLLPLGLDSHRYRCCGNGVVSSVSEWIGLRLAATFEERRSEVMA